MKKQKSQNLPKLIMTMSIIILLGALFGAVFYLLNQSEKSDTPSENKSINQKQFIEEKIALVKNASYIFKDENIKLFDGSFLKEDNLRKLEVKIPENKISFGKLDNDDIEYAAVVLDIVEDIYYKEGGSDFFHYYHLAVLKKDNDKYSYVDSIPLGDREKIESILIKENKIIINMLVRGLEDALCCPTLPNVSFYKLKNNKLMIFNENESVKTLAWKTYRNEEYGFEMKYPENYYTKEKSTSVWNEKESIVTLSSSERFEKEIYSFLMSIENIDDFDKTISYKKNNKIKESDFEKLQITAIEDLLDTEIISTFTGNSPWGYYFVYIKNPNKDNKGILLTVRISPNNAIGYEKEKSDFDVFREILSTFRFIENSKKIENTSKNKIVIKASPGLKSFIIENNGQKIGKIETEQESNIKIFREFEDSIYFGIEYSGLGGYILYGGPHSIYRFVTVSNVFSKFGDYVENGFYTDVYIDGAKNVNIVYIDNRRKIVYEKTDFNIKKEFDPSDKYNIFGDALISPDGDKIAYSAALGDPDNEESSIFIIDIKTNKQIEVANKKGDSYQIKGWIDNDIIDY